MKPGWVKGRIGVEEEGFRDAGEGGGGAGLQG